MIQVTNINNQLRIVDSGRIEFYKFEEITNVAWNRSAEDKYYVLITFDSDYLLRIELSRIDNQPTWTNNLVGAQAAVIQISIWMNTAVAAITAILTAIEIDTTAIAVSTAAIDASIDVNLSTVATELTLAAVNTKLTAAVRTPAIKRYVNIPGTTQVGAYSFSIANVGTADGTVDGVIIPAGLTISYDGGALNNTLLDISFDATGTIFIVTYIS